MFEYYPVGRPSRKGAPHNCPDCGVLIPKQKKRCAPCADKEFEAQQQRRNAERKEKRLVARAEREGA